MIFLQGCSKDGDYYCSGNDLGHSGIITVTGQSWVGNLSGADGGDIQGTIISNSSGTFLDNNSGTVVGTIDWEGISYNDPKNGEHYFFGKK